MDGDHHHQSVVDPLLIGVYGILAGAIVVAAYHCVTTRYHYQTRNESTSSEQQSPLNNNDGATSTSHSTIVNIPISTYSKEHCDEETCSVCLSEFIEGQEIRVLPECFHSFHAPCIDTWLNLHSNCPLCRAKAMPERQTVLSLITRIPAPEVQQVPETGE